MSNQIHGHKVMEMMLESKQTFTRETLQDKIVQHFGENARFFTCSKNDMTASELITFLRSKGKIIQCLPWFLTDRKQICKPAS